MGIKNEPSGNFETCFDPVRKKHVALTPEERVRQQFIQYLHTQKSVPLSLMQIEKELIINNLRKRYDIVVCSNQGIPRLLVECKAPSISLNNKTFEQAAHYNLSLKVPYLVITNGTQTYCCQLNFETQSIEFLKEIPEFGVLNGVR